MITPIERYVLESILRKNDSLLKLHYDTELEIDILDKVISSLRTKCFIADSMPLKSLNKQILRSDNTFEISQIAKKTATLDDSFKFDSYCLSLQDEKILNSMFGNIESFLKERSQKKYKLSSSNYIFWGSLNRSKYINHLFN